MAEAAVGVSNAIGELLRPLRAVGTAQRLASEPSFLPKMPERKANLLPNPKMVESKFMAINVSGSRRP